MPESSRPPPSPSPLTPRLSPLASAAGKTFLAELIALALHGPAGARVPHFQRFSMQNYKTDEDMWKLVSPPCGIKGEGAFASIFEKRAHCGFGGNCVGEVGGAAGSGGEGCDELGSVVLFDEIEEARADFMTSALVNAIDHCGFVEYTRKTAEGTCPTFRAPTAGSFIVLTSNCFMDDLAEVLESQRRLRLGEAELYGAVRAEMDRRIFEEKIDCDRHGTPSPFASQKMRDRMRGNLYPFLPLTPEQTTAAFEAQLARKAESYEARQGVGLYWTPGYARLVVPKPGARPRIEAGGGGDAAASASAARSRAISEAPSLRKRIQEMVSLGPDCVEELYAKAFHACRTRGGKLRRLVLHAAGGVAGGATEMCEGGGADEGGREGEGEGEGSARGGVCAAGRDCAATESSAASDAAYGAGPAAAAAPAPHSSAHPREIEAERERDTPREAEVAAAVASALEREREQQREREAALSAEVARLVEQVADLQAQLLRWKLACLALAVGMALLLLFSAHLVVAYTAKLVVLTVYAVAGTALALAGAAAVAAVLCWAGVGAACAALETLVQLLRWVSTLAGWAWAAVRLAVGALGAWGRAAAACCALLYVVGLLRHARRQRAAQRAAAEERALAATEVERAKAASRAAVQAAQEEASRTAADLRHALRAAQARCAQGEARLAQLEERVQYWKNEAEEAYTKEAERKEAAKQAEAQEGGAKGGTAGTGLGSQVKQTEPGLMDAMQAVKNSFTSAAVVGTNTAKGFANSAKRASAAGPLADAEDMPLKGLQAELDQRGYPWRGNCVEREDLVRAVRAARKIGEHLAPCADPDGEGVKLTADAGGGEGKRGATSTTSGAAPAAG